MNFELLEKELKKRLKFDYNWGRKQEDAFDELTNFIYKTANFDILLQTIETKFKSNPKYNDLKNYALNRWFNFWSAKAIEAIFCEHKNVYSHSNQKNKYIDFYIFNIPFDHKTTVFPKKFKKSIPYAINHKEELITWLYKNQSNQQRMHFKNRLFIVLVDFNDKTKHWKLKAEILWLKKKISSYLINFDATKLTQLKINNSIVTSDIIWAIK